MHTVFDVADWFLSKEKMTHKKLQKLCYYAQAWSYAIQPEPISDAKFEAWVHGPVCYELYQKYKEYGFSFIPQCEKPDVFSDDEEAFLGDVWDTYGEYSATSLEVHTHNEPPWQIARIGYAPDEQSRVEILPENMKNYYLSIYDGGNA